MSWINKITDGLSGKRDGKGHGKVVRSNTLNIDEADSLTDPFGILQTLRPWVAEEKQMLVKLHGHNEQFLTHFAPEGHNAASLLERQGVLIRPLYPMIGNAKVRGVDRVTLNVSTDDHLYQLEVPFREVVFGNNRRRNLMMGFPKRLLRWPQLRGTPRTVLDRTVSLHSETTRASGTTFEVPVRDVAHGGLSFWKPEEEADLAAGTRLQCLLTSKSLERPIRLSGRVGRTRTVQGKPFVRLRFDQLRRGLGKQVKVMLETLHEESGKRQQWVFQN